MNDERLTVHRVQREVCGRTLSFEYGRVARQADAGVLARYGDSVVLASAAYKKEPVEYMSFFPLVVDYRELAYAAGKIPGGFFKREGKPRDKETLTCRLIDRPIRPLFPAGFRSETQIVEYLLSTDMENESEFLGLVAASAALSISEIPFLGPLGACRIGKLGGELVCNPSMMREDESEIWLMVAGIEDRVMMIAGRAQGMSIEELDQAVKLARPVIRDTIEMQQELAAAVGKPKLVVDKPVLPPEIVAEVRSRAAAKVLQINDIEDKLARNQAAVDLQRLLAVELAEKFGDAGRNPDMGPAVQEALDELFKQDTRRRILEREARLDGRGLDEVRPVECTVPFLPRTHGSALFTRGQTQSLAATTLGTKSDEQVVDDVELVEEEKKRFMLHYNFPPFSTGEVRFLRGPGRREIGHGDLAESSLAAVIPPEESFPYTIRIVSDILESNGSSSMASVCAGSLSLMDAGVPVKAAVAGVAMGLVKDDGRYKILTDILGAEDHYGDMDFKVAGTRQGITGIQLDLKLPGVPYSILREAVVRATEARMRILDVMDATLDKPRPELSKYAPRIESIVIPKDKIGTVIGPGGKMIRKITEETGATVDIEDDGTVTIASNNPEALERARTWIESLVAEVEVGRTYRGAVTRIISIGAFVEVLPGKEGMVHISELGPGRVRSVSDVLRLGDSVLVKVKEIDQLGRVNLALAEPLARRPDTAQGSPDQWGDAGRPSRHERPRRGDHRSGRPRMRDRRR